MKRAASKGVGAAIGAAAAALLSTACCWVPLTLVVVGAGASSLALTQALESMRWPLVGVAGALLLWAHWRVYGQQARAEAACCDGEAPCPPKRTHQRWGTHLMLWMATVKVGLLAVYPQAVLALLSPAPPSVEAQAGEVQRAYRVEGPSLCEGCIPQLEAALMRVEGVVRVQVVLARGEVQVWWREGASPSDVGVSSAGEGVGLLITPLPRG